MYKLRSRQVLVVLLCLVCYIITFPSAGKAHSIKNSYRTAQSSITTKQWMSALPDNTKLTSLTIPGTHDTMSYKGNISWTLTKALAQTQKMSLFQQLEAGIRYIDIRAKEDLQIYHGPIYLDASLKGVLETTVNFLKEHPKETIIMRLKDENNHKNDRFDYRIQPLINQYKAFFYTTPKSDSSDKFPTLKELRGKILLLLENGTNKPLTINYSKFGMKFAAENQVIQDNFNGPTIETKYNEIVQTTHQAFKQSSGENKLYLNHVSATSLTCTPYQYASTLNAKVDQYVTKLTAVGVRGLGVFIMDFPPKQRIKSVIKNNKFN
ncbi:1-phosphatidylinositol phosphodiesterase [Listeria ivanovii]|uniref:phosphatidylinositol-specific phospholipase C domain-containing protein n=1 Tax=Listeria ivanovii TaxID=1638 RepID=UPI000DA9C163|nr:phosphatidylinositol-specific phospholipase C domain-containing protein [Listeria ivanovii]PZF89986.1 1-phosphatidylinositol phosphodiesterase [Listeria ivanovii]PZF94374.1 1-phosphatidylinositol phosphodiesterase [Listeria ivanovii]PZG04513.1 1-phosphatidylinositol phosphodiesterase [Listeria ivanovii]PZG09566.1 1-phosphatidylinositol phosphodiesterase [Listeria ivanovii]PZG27503.1 1-phosphatidylinositol phosphodiesterase [Listeria ivanovii]